MGEPEEGNERDLQGFRLDNSSLSMRFSFLSSQVFGDVELEEDLADISNGLFEVVPLVQLLRGRKNRRCLDTNCAHRQRICDCLIEKQCPYSFASEFW